MSVSACIVRDRSKRASVNQRMTEGRAGKEKGCAERDVREDRGGRRARPKDELMRTEGGGFIFTHLQGGADVTAIAPGQRGIVDSLPDSLNWIRGCLAHVQTIRVLGPAPGTPDEDGESPAPARTKTAWSYGFERP